MAENLAGLGEGVALRTDEGSMALAPSKALNMLSAVNAVPTASLETFPDELDEPSI